MAKQTRKITLISAGAILAMLAILFFWAYFTPFRDPASTLLKRFAPQVVVGGRMVSVNDFEQAEEIAVKFGVSSSNARAKQLMYEKSEELARQFNLPINDDAAADEFKFFTKGNESEYLSLLKSHYGGSERLFYKYAIYPQVVDAALRIHYNNGQKSISPAYKEAQEVLTKIQSGESFETLAQTHSDDQTSGSIGGDLGFYQQGQLIPELDDQASISAKGEVRPEIITTRLGYHIIYPIIESAQNGTRQYNIKHILFVPDGYETWLQSQTNSINTIKFLYK
jgi:hypothetical protein